jgi:mannose-6-phosphate isomerase-like protein (cupin superfamily)
MDSDENFRKVYKNRNLPRSGLLEPANAADGLQPPLICTLGPRGETEEVINQENPMSESQQHPYATYLDIKFPALTLVDVPALVSACKDQWYNQTLCKVNDSVVRLGIMQGEYHWHKHDDDDEFFFVLDGHFIIDLESGSIDLQPRQGYVVPKSVVHRTRAPDRAVILMVETAAIVPTGDA